MKNNVIVATFVIAMLSACTESDGGDAAANYASFSGTIEGLTTRAHDAAWDAGDGIGVSVASTDGATSGTNVEYTTATTGGSFASSNPIEYADGKSVTFTAYYPYAASGGTITISTLAANQTATKQKSIDYMFATGTGRSAVPEVNFVFRHKMSQITLNFTKGNVDALTGLSFKLSGLKHSGTFSTTTGTVALSSSATATDIEIAPTVASGATAVSQSVILIPQEVSEVELAVSLSGNTYKSTLKLPSSTNNQLLAGYNVKYDIEVNQTNLKSSDGDIIGWNTQGGDYSSVALGTYSADEAQVLDLAMSDGTFLRVWSEDADELAANVAAIGDDRASDIVGIVYWVSTETDYPTRDDKLLARDYPWCTHGYILALKDADIGTSWQPYSSNESVYDNFQSLAIYPSDIYQSILIECTTGADGVYEDPPKLNKALGYNNTQILRAYNYYGCESEYQVIPIDEVEHYAEIYKSPKGSSGWFLPSPKELVLIAAIPETILYQAGYNTVETNVRLKNLRSVISVISKQYDVADEFVLTLYWSSTEGKCFNSDGSEAGSDFAFCVSWYGGDYMGYVDCPLKYQYNCLVRAVCAF
jgi:hypothetical protein